MNHLNLSYRSTNVKNLVDQTYPLRNNQLGKQFQARPFIPVQAQQTFTHGFQNKNAGYGNIGFQPKQQFKNVDSQDRVGFVFQQVLDGQK